MSRSWKYYLLLAVLVLLLSAELFLPKPVSWMKTFSSDDKIPYGTYLFKHALTHQEPVDRRITRESFYEMADSLNTDILSISRTMANGQDDLEALIEFVRSGNNAVIAANNFGKEWDSIGISTTDLLQLALVEDANPIAPDSTEVLFDGREIVFMAEDNAHVFSHDSTWQVIARHSDGEPVVIKRTFLKGQLLLTSNPYIFTNYYLLRDNSIPNYLLGHLDPTFTWTELYSRGRAEPQTPIRYILTQPALKWAYYITILTLLVMVVFEAKRKQRAIPLMTLPRNDSLDFAKTVGNLYYEQRNHRKVADKMIAYVLEHIRSSYFLSTSELDDEFYRLLAHKSGQPLMNIESLFTLISIIHTSDEIEEDQLMDLNTKIEAFIHGRQQIRTAG